MAAFRLNWQLLLQMLCTPGVVCWCKTYKFFKNADVLQILPLPPASSPESLRGLYWMDQIGFYSHSDVPVGAPDLALSFGGDSSFHTLDLTTRVLKVDVSGPGWQWTNRWDAYLFAELLHMLSVHYEFHFDADFSFAQIVPRLSLPLVGVVGMPTWLLSFTMVRQVPPAGACPPPSGASKKDIAKCAAWDRVSSGLLSPLLGSYGVFHYYVWKIVDEDGAPVQPYYDAYLAYAEQLSRPSPMIASLLGIDLGKEGAVNGTAFVRLREPPSKPAPDGKAGEL